MKMGLEMAGAVVTKPGNWANWGWRQLRWLLPPPWNSELEDSQHVFARILGPKVNRISPAFVGIYRKMLAGLDTFAPNFSYETWEYFFQIQFVFPLQRKKTLTERMLAKEGGGRELLIWIFLLVEMHLLRKFWQP